MYYKQIEDNILTAIGTSKSIGNNQIEISESEYNNILSIIQTKPDDTDTIVYKLNAETLEYEPYDRPEEPTPEPTYSEDYLNGYDQAILDMMGVE